MSETPSRAAARRGRTLKLYLADGTPSGVITAKLGVSSVHASAAAAGRADIGRTTWRVEGNGQSYVVWRSSLIGDGSTT